MRNFPSFLNQTLLPQTFLITSQDANKTEYESDDVKSEPTIFPEAQGLPLTSKAEAQDGTLDSK